MHWLGANGLTPARRVTVRTGLPSIQGLAVCSHDQQQPQPPQQPQIHMLVAWGGGVVEVHTLEAAAAPAPAAAGSGSVPGDGGRPGITRLAITAQALAAGSNMLVFASERAMHMCTVLGARLASWEVEKVRRAFC